MRKFTVFFVALLSLPLAHAAPTQLTIEAEQVAGGTITADTGASGGSTVTRTTDGIYVWWLPDTSKLTTGTYSLYARVALSSPTATSASFGPGVYYGNTAIATQTVAVTNHEYAWIRLTSFDLTQVGGQLRVSDWSGIGIKVDKLAIVKDVVVEAELASTSTVVNDPNASGGRAVTISSPGNYSWWTVPTADLLPGDYTVYALLASADGLAHNFGESVSLDNVNSGSVNRTVSSTSYQWVELNNFVYAAGSQSVLVADYSEPKMKLDKVRLVRRTPYEATSATQALFASGAAALGPKEQVIFNGIPSGFTAMKDPGRISIVQASPTTTYAYFRQELTPPGTKNYVFQIYMATSTDGGKTFTVNPSPVISANSTTLKKAYDQHVTKRSDGYYMVFEGVTDVCGFSAVAAYSPDGVNNWVVKNTPVCSAGTIPSLGASVPNYYFNVETNQQYIQWATIDEANLMARRYQYALPNGLFQGQLKFSAESEIHQYAFPEATAGTWEARNNSSGTTIYEDGYYYMVYDGSAQHNCTGRWGLGVRRSNTPAVISSWTKSIKNPFVSAVKDDNCWVQYPAIARLPAGLYLYYNDAYTNYVPEPQPNSLTIFRHKIIPN